MTKLLEAAKEAREALKENHERLRSEAGECYTDSETCKINLMVISDLSAAIRQAEAAPSPAAEREPVFWIDPINFKEALKQDTGTYLRYITRNPQQGDVALYTAPQSNAALERDVPEREGFYEKLWKEFCSLQSGDVQLLCEDAKRYRWLRDTRTTENDILEIACDDVNPPHFTLKTTNDLDSAIDAAIEREGKKA